MVAILTIALHAVLPVAAIAAPSASVDPFTVICHGGGSGPASSGDFAPSKVCDHCTLCFAATFALTLDDVPAGRLLPARVLHVLTPASTFAGGNALATPRLARAPPQPA